MSSFGRLLMAGALCVCTGCGTGLESYGMFAYALRSPDGEQLVLDDLREIARDDDLTEEEKREAFRDLGLEDEDVIDALLTL